MLDELYKYFTFDVNTIQYNGKSGTIGEDAFDKLINTSGLIKYNKQVKLNVSYYDKFNNLTINYNIKPDFLSQYEAVEIKNLMGPGTAYEKILYTLSKYMSLIVTNQCQNVKIILCRDFETIILPIIKLIKSQGLLDMYNDCGIYFCLFSDLLVDYYVSLKEDMTLFLKWVGGKTKLLLNIKQCINSVISKTQIYTYIEPFVGGGSVLFDVIQTYNPPKVIAMDLNKELITLYITIQSDVEGLINTLKQLSNTQITEEVYYKYRNDYNQLIKSNNNPLLLSALFIILNKSCFRGIYRVNRNNEFNVPYGNYKKISIFEESYYSLLRNISKLIANVTFYHYDFMNIFNFIEQNSINIATTLFYLDPPYLGTFDSYQSNGFNNNQFVEVIKKIPNKIVSNSYEFYEQYGNLFLNSLTIEVNDSVNSKKPNNKRKEVLLY